MAAGMLSVIVWPFHSRANLPLTRQSSSTPPTPPAASHASTAAVASSLALLGTRRASHANRLECVPASYLPTVGLADSLDTCVDHPPTRRAVRRGDNLPLSCLVAEAVANLKIRGEDLGIGCCLWFALLLGE